MNTNLAILLVLVAAALVGVVIFFNHRSQKKRAEAMARVAGDLKLAFAPEGDEAAMSEHAAFHLFLQGRSKKIRNLMRGTVRDSNIAIFDYQYTVGAGKHQHTWSQTVISLRPQGRNLPAFTMRPENVFHKLGSMMGYQDIDFESNPTFSKKYLLRGPDDAAIRSVFTSRVLMFFESEPGLCVEADGRTLIVYRHSVRVDPELLRESMEKGIQIAGLFQR
ncbi:MAG: hypothetical protein NTW97_01420 [Candidatus Krumholzibacteria bacterium]|nr:hypothetical protein [Candidatus Krumholzibacteria bacterium]